MGGASDAVLIYADTVRSAELRHEVPLTVPDPFLYLEHAGGRAVVVPSMEAGRIRDAVPELEAVVYEELGWDELLASGLSRPEVVLELSLRACRRFGVERARVPPEFPIELADRLRAEAVELSVDRELFEARRRVKNDVELAGIRRAQRACEAALDAARAMLRSAEPDDGVLRVDGEPVTCERLKREISAVFAEHDAAADEFIVSHGPQTAVGHELGHGPIAPNEPILFDLWPRDRASGCYADMTRVYVVGEPAEEIREYHRLALEALERSLESLRAGVNGRTLMQQACDLFHEHGYPTQLHKAAGAVLEDGFYHALGHGIGLEVHEEPMLGRLDSRLVAGDVVAIEPGLYRSGFGGVRLEDAVLVTGDGCEDLSSYPYDLTP